MMTQSTPIAPGAQPFILPGGPIGVLIVHGYGGSIGDYRLFAEQLQARGYTVSGLRLAGHGQGLAELRQTHLADWQRSVAEAVQKLRQICRRVVVMGASFGGTLALDLAEQGSGVDGLVIINPAIVYRGAWWQKIILSVWKVFSPYYPKFGLNRADKAKYRRLGSTTGWPIDGLWETQKFITNQVVPRLASVTIPVLVMANAHDPVVSEAGIQLISKKLTQAPLRQVTIPGQTHRPFRDPIATGFMVDQVAGFLQGLAVGR